MNNLSNFSNAWEKIWGTTKFAITKKLESTLIKITF